jgi:hypothetical protein
MVIFCNIGYFGNGGIARLVTKVTTKKMVTLVINMTMNIKGLLYYFDINQNFNSSGSFSRCLHYLLRRKYVRWEQELFHKNRRTDITERYEFVWNMCFFTEIS